jgi:site-specific DNA-cytosine methylase
MIKHATVVPLIGGETIGQEQAFGSRPDYLMSYEAFWQNDQHIVNHYNNEVPYYVLDKGHRPDHKVDVIGSVCPCAGLSQLSHGYGDDNQNNKWMIDTTKFVLEEMHPKVLWGENAPGFAGKIGDKVRNQLRQIGKENGYTMTVYRTKTILHGGPQVRNRSFYFFWKGDKTPLLSYFNRPHKKIEDVILGALGNTQRETINSKIPSQDPYYKYVLEHIHGGLTHREFAALMKASGTHDNDTQAYIEKRGINYLEVAEWMKINGFEKQVKKCEYKADKLSRGLSIMRRGTIVPKDYIGAFVGHYPTSLTHPIEDRYINYREAMTIMGLPDNFELIDPKKNVNHICQNVPVQTAADMAGEIKKWINGELEELNTDYIYQSNLSQTHEYNSAATSLESFF